jgi:putative component of membrane protein insertase Oxa1/YidC/SpoIIIJ protein YidD
MSWKIITCILISFLIITENAAGQSKTDLDKLRKIYPVEKKSKGPRIEINTKNEVQLLLTAGFSFYKRYISPQDALSCSFYPSCSVYALETIEMNGIAGIFDAIDRLTRCNGFSPEKYEQHSQSHLFYDPVKNIRTSY